MAPRRPNQPKLTREQIVAAALKLIDEHGLEGHTMRQLGAELGVDPSSIYYYVPSKSDLYNLIVDGLTDAIDVSVDNPSASFEDRLMAVALEYRRALLLHPKAMPLAATRSLRTAAQLRPVEILLSIFFDAGFNETEALAATDILGMTVLGMTNAYAAHITGAEYHEHDDEFDDVPVEQYPNFHRIMGSAEYLGFDLEFQRGIRALAIGLKTLHDSGALGAKADTGDLKC